MRENSSPAVVVVEKFVVPVGCGVVGFLVVVGVVPCGANARGVGRLIAFAGMVVVVVRSSIAEDVIEGLGEVGGEDALGEVDGVDAR